jgi:crotonobetainyl-CoA:carnitine CoA-transferase CaiB-like acyl-CoA transferase
MSDLALSGIRVVTLAPNVPGPVAAARLRDLGADVMKVEPPAGDPLVQVAPRWYAALHRGMRVETLDLKTSAGRDQLDALLAESDVLLTSSRLSALQRLGLGWDDLHARHPKLVNVAIVGLPPPDDERAGHDLNYVGDLGLIEPPSMPRTLLADLAGSERAVSATLALLLRREREGSAGCSIVSLRDAAAVFGEPLAHGLTLATGPLGGGQGIYGLYRAKTGWVAVAALEPHFARKVVELVGGGKGDTATLAAAFAEREPSDWVAWADEHDLPISEVR